MIKSLERKILRRSPELKGEDCGKHRDFRMIPQVVINIGAYISVVVCIGVKSSVSYVTVKVTPNKIDSFSVRAFCCCYDGKWYPLHVCSSKRNRSLFIAALRLR